MNGGAGSDTAGFEFAAAAVDVDLTTGLATGDGNDTLADIENAVGSPGADTMRGNGAANRLKGVNGNDVLRVARANDTLSGGAGNDRAYGQSGNDRLAGNAGNDLLNGGTGAHDRCNGGPGVDAGPKCEVKVSIP